MPYAHWFLSRSAAAQRTANKKRVILHVARIDLENVHVILINDSQDCQSGPLPGVTRGIRKVLMRGAEDVGKVPQVSKMKVAG